jgi:hypothetical protein
MKRKYRYDEDRPSNKARIIKDFLPPPEEIVLPTPENTKITITIDLPSLEFFKSQAKRLRGKYQRMMREVLRRYAQIHSSPH